MFNEKIQINYAELKASTILYQVTWLIYGISRFIFYEWSNVYLMQYLFCPREADNGYIENRLVFFFFLRHDTAQRLNFLKSR